MYILILDLFPSVDINTQIKEIGPSLNRVAVVVVMVECGVECVVAVSVYPRVILLCKPVEGVDS